jgi:hypothetical protein
VALAIAGSLVSVTEGHVGVALLGVALMSTAVDAAFGVSLGRRLTPERASQNVVARPHQERDAPNPAIRLVVTANYDAGRTGVIYREGPRRIPAGIRSATSAALPGWLGWLCIGFVWLLVVAVFRLGGGQSTALGVAQFVPTALLVVVLAALLELSTAAYGPAANDNGSGAAVAVALVRALDAAPPRHMAVELLLAGAGEGGGLGLRQHLRRREFDRTNAAVLAFAASGAGGLRWWTSDGSFVPLRYSKRLRQLCAQISDQGDVRPRRGGDVRPHRGRGSSPALAARAAGIPAMALGCVDERGLVPRSHQPDDTAAGVEAAALDATVEFALILVDALDSFLAETEIQRQTAPPPRAAPAAST